MDAYRRRPRGLLADAIARGGPMDALPKRLAARQARCAELEDHLARHIEQHPYVNLAGLEQRLRAKLADWRGLLERNIEDGRAVLRALLVGPLRFTPVNEPRRRGYKFDGIIALDRLVAGVVDLPTRKSGIADESQITRVEGASPPGFEGKLHALHVPFAGELEVRRAA